MKNLAKMLLIALTACPCTINAEEPNEEIESQEAEASSISSQTDDNETSKGPKINQLYIESRLAFTGENNDGNWNNDNTGFRGQFINLRFDGQIVDGLTFSYRQRLNKASKQTFWDATDWLHLDWQATDRWKVSAGKQVVGWGGFEYDRAPIDLYYCSEFWYHIPCYQLGASAAYNATKNDQLVLQVCNSPFRAWSGNNNTYDINLQWYGKHGWYESMFSASMMQCYKGRWINYIGLGNRFNITKKLRLDVDYYNRATNHQTFLFKDCSLISELSYQPCEAVRCYGKYTFDQNKSGIDVDKMLVNGTRMQMTSLGFEVNPIKKYRDGLRVFGSAAYSWGHNPDPEGVLQNHQWQFQAGIKFRLDVLEGFNYFMNRHNRNK